MLLMNIARGDKAKRFQGEEALVGVKVAVISVPNYVAAFPERYGSPW